MLKATVLVSMSVLCFVTSMLLVIFMCKALANMPIASILMRVTIIVRIMLKTINKQPNSNAVHLRHPVVSKQLIVGALN